ncbi:MAG: O-acetylhomoserine aminocarboxypropyltransferase/cysteine synthase [Candidatus Methanoplasma sp.]|jgi:O-acetylhomoserine (thiol)-lyase|nr:O-acetylhomoserine aminocarboxypropyltransferase/cysteine synthase [Candidatus Methanoplasma sp.]
MGILSKGKGDDAPGKIENIPTGPNNPKKLGFDTLQIHRGQEAAGPNDERAVPIYLTTSYVFKDSKQAADRFGLREGGNIYGRLTNSTQGVLEERIAALEGGSAALAVASGAAAVTYTIQNLANSGDHIVAANNLYGGTYNLLFHTFPRLGIKTTFVDPSNLKNFETAIKPNTKAILIETFGNPNSDIIDVDAIAEIAHKNKIPLVVDNTFATPYLFRPIEHGADIVIESATKFIGGHGVVLGGLIIEGGNFDWEASGKFPLLVDPDASYHGVSFWKALGPAAFVTRIRAVILRDTGSAISPVTAFSLLLGLEDLSLRVDRHTENALKVVDYLSKHSKVTKLNHPALKDHPSHKLYEKYFPEGAGSIFTFDIKGGEAEAKKFIDSLELFSLLANVADVKSLVIHPATTTHSQLTSEELKEQNIHPSTVRLSIGTENVKDIIADLEQAFGKI